jgi:hypothetical protein
MNTLWKWLSISIHCIAIPIPRLDAWEDLDTLNYMDWCMSICKFWYAYCFQGIMKGLKVKSCGYWWINWFVFTNLNPLLWKIVIHNCPFVQNGNICTIWLNSPKVKVSFGSTYYHYKESSPFQPMSLQLVSKSTIFASWNVNVLCGIC